MSEDTFPPQVGDVWRVTSETSKEWVEFRVLEIIYDSYCDCVCTNPGTFDTWNEGERDEWKIAENVVDDVWTLVDREL